jgi:hypothetical protein
MIGLPEFKQKVRVWPMPGRQVQNGHAPVDPWGGGRWLPSRGAWVIWSAHYLEQLQAGDLLLHPPPCTEHKHLADDKGTEGAGECECCGRMPDEAAAYDADRAAGIAAARKDNPKLAEAPKPEPEAKPYSFIEASRAHFEQLEKAAKESKVKGQKPELEKARTTAPPAPPSSSQK